MALLSLNDQIFKNFRVDAILPIFFSKQRSNLTFKVYNIYSLKVKFIKVRKSLGKTSHALHVSHAKNNNQHILEYNYKSTY